MEFIADIVESYCELLLYLLFATRAQQFPLGNCSGITGDVFLNVFSELGKIYCKVIGF